LLCPVVGVELGTPERLNIEVEQKKHPWYYHYYKERLG
jgi:hypothetical protein